MERGNDLKIINIYKEQKQENLTPTFINSELEINKYWLAGFIDGDATFSTHGINLRLKFENHIKELPLFNKIIQFFKEGKICINKPRSNRNNSNSTVSLDYTNILFLKRVIEPLFSNLLKSKKAKDFKDWVILPYFFKKKNRLLLYFIKWQVKYKILWL